MRSTLVLSLVLVGALALAGCSGGSSDSSTSTTASGSTSGSKTPTKSATNSTPNLPPLIVLKVTDSTGAATNSTMVFKDSKAKGNLTFSAVGSKDQDTDGLSAIAISVKDANRTYPPGVLYAAGKFSSVTYDFDRAGPVNVTVSGIDNRGDVTTVTRQVYVNYKDVNAGNAGLQLSDSGHLLVDANECVYDSGAGDLVDNKLTEGRKFDTLPTTTWVEAKVTAGTAQIAICAPGTPPTAISPNADSGDTVVTNAGTDFVATVGDALYFVFIVSESTGTPPDFNKVTIETIVHYDPQPAA